VICIQPWFFSIGRLHFGQGLELASILKFIPHITYQRLRKKKKKKIIIKSLTLIFMRWPMHLTPGDWVIPWQGKTWAKYEM
jgi:predicted small integral membrane protein